MKNKRKNIYDQLVSWSWGWLTPRPSAGDEWPHSVAFLSGWHHWWLGLGPLYGWLQSCRFRRADEAEIYQTVPTEMARRAVRLPACWPRQKQRGVLLQEKKKKKNKTSQPLFTVSFIRKEKKKKKEATQEMTWLKVNAAPFSCTTTLNPPCSSTCHALPFTHLSARPFLVRPEMTMGSKGSSVPEIVMPSGPLYLFNSTV